MPCPCKRCTSCPTTATCGCADWGNSILYTPMEGWRFQGFSGGCGFLTPYLDASYGISPPGPLTLMLQGTTTELVSGLWPRSVTTYRSSCFVTSAEPMTVRAESCPTNENPTPTPYIETNTGATNEWIGLMYFVVYGPYTAVGEGPGGSDVEHPSECLAYVQLWPMNVTTFGLVADETGNIIDIVWGGLDYPEMPNQGLYIDDLNDPPQCGPGAPFPAEPCVVDPNVICGRLIDGLWTYYESPPEAGPFIASYNHMMGVPIHTLTAGATLTVCDPAVMVARWGSSIGMHLSYVFGGTGIFSGGISGDPEFCTEDPPCDGCRVLVTVVDLCPEECPPLAYYVTNPATGWRSATRTAVRGTSVPGLGDTHCTYYVLSAPFCAGTTPAVAEFRGEVDDVLLRSVDVPDCNPVLVFNADQSPDYVVFTGCIIGCPSGPLEDARVYLFLTDQDTGAIIASETAVVNEEGCFRLSMGIPPGTTSSPGPFGTLLGTVYGLEIDIVPPGGGYQSPQRVSTEVMIYPAGDACQTIDLGTLVALPDEDHVCTCAGLLNKCLNWNGNGADILVRYDGQEAITGKHIWRGIETINEGIANDGETCLDEGGAGTGESSDIEVTLLVSSNAEPTAECLVEAYRLVPYCLCGGDYISTPCYTAECDGIGPLGGTPRLAAYDAESETPAAGRVISYDQRVTAAWGPVGIFPGSTLNSWTRETGETDDNRCYAPDQAYTAVVVTNANPGACDPPPVGGGAPGPEEQAFAAANEEPPLPGLITMGKQVIRTARDVVVRYAQTGEFSASKEEQARRWSICRGCEHFRSTDQRCGQVKNQGCGCWLTAAIPLAAKSCPLDEPKWGPAPISGAGSTDTSRTSSPDPADEPDALR